MPIKFRFRWIPFFATIVVVAIGIALGQWQTRRAAEKEAIEARLVARESAPPVAVNGVVRPADEMEFQRVSVRGEFVRDWPVYLDNRPHNSIAGFYVLMPLKIAGSDMHILVARGWIARDPSNRVKLPSFTTPEGVVKIEGIARRNPGRLLQLGRAEPLHPQAIVQNAEIAEFEQAGKFRMQPFMIEQTNDAGDGLVRDWPHPSVGIEKHRGYAFQWYALAATAFLFFVVTGFRRGRQ